MKVQSHFLLSVAGLFGSQSKKPSGVNGRFQFLFATSVGLLLGAFALNAQAGTYYWWGNYDASTKSDSPLQACVKLASETTAGSAYSFSNPRISAKTNNAQYLCLRDTVYTAPWGVVTYFVDTTNITLEGDVCAVQGYSLDPETGVCHLDRYSKGKGTPQQSVCSMTGDPINFMSGNNVQTETDYQGISPFSLSFYRTYNSLDGIWRNNYSMHLRVGSDQIALVMNDGRETYFSIAQGIVTPISDERGVLYRGGDSWTYEGVDNSKYQFDSQGRLVEWDKPNGVEVSLVYSDVSGITVSSNFGEKLNFTADTFGQPRSLSVQGIIFQYSYNSDAHLSALVKNHNGLIQTRKYKYEDIYNSSLLTSISDEREKTVATWAYDDQGRAVSSELNGGVGKVSVIYHEDESTVVINELGRQTTYLFSNSNDVKRITSVRGEPTPNCPASNSRYIYDSNGLLIQNVDALNNVTQYTYN